MALLYALRRRKIAIHPHGRTCEDRTRSRGNGRWRSLGLFRQRRNRALYRSGRRRLPVQLPDRRGDHDAGRVSAEDAPRRVDRGDQLRGSGRRPAPWSSPKRPLLRRRSSCSSRRRSPASKPTSHTSSRSASSMPTARNCRRSRRRTTRSSTSRSCRTSRWSSVRPIRRTPSSSPTDRAADFFGARRRGETPSPEEAVSILARPPLPLAGQRKARRLPPCGEAGFPRFALCKSVLEMPREGYPPGRSAPYPLKFSLSSLRWPSETISPTRGRGCPPPTGYIPHRNAAVWIGASQAVSISSSRSDTVIEQPAMSSEVT